MESNLLILRTKIEQQIITDAKQASTTDELSVELEEIEPGEHLAQDNQGEVVLKQSKTPAVISTFIILCLLGIITFSSFRGGYSTGSIVVAVCFYFVFGFAVIRIWFIGNKFKPIKLGITGVKLHHKNLASWDNIIAVYFKFVGNGKKRRVFFVIALKQGSYMEQEIFEGIGSGYARLEYYVQMFQPKPTNTNTLELIN